MLLLCIDMSIFIYCHYFIIYASSIKSSGLIIQGLNYLSAIKCFTAKKIATKSVTVAFTSITNS